MKCEKYFWVVIFWKIFEIFFEVKICEIWSIFSQKWRFYVKNHVKCEKYGTFKLIYKKMMFFLKRNNIYKNHTSQVFSHNEM